MTKEERMKEIAKASPNFGKRVGYKMCVVDELHDMKELLEKNAELKAYNEKLLDGDIEKHNKIVELEEENSRLKQIILGNEMEIAAKDETIEELKKTSSRILNKLFR